MSLPWSEKTLKATPVGADEVMILDSEDSDPDTINKRALLSSIPSAGETNTASNVGTGEEVFKQKDGVNLEFRSLLGETDKITLAENTNDITFTLGSLVVLTDQANTYSAGAKQSFVANAFAGINLNAEIPNTLEVGDIYRTAEEMHFIATSAEDKTLVDLTEPQTLENKTLDAPIISTIFNGGPLTLPTGEETLVGRDTTDTLTDKTLTLPTIATIDNSGTLTLPTGPETLVGLSTTDTLANKTLTAPVISTIFNIGTLTLPTSTDVLVGRATSDIFTNKTFDANGTGNSLSNVDVADLANGQDGELITWDSSGVATTVAVGTSGEVLTSQGTGNPPIFASTTTGTLSVVRREGDGDISVNRLALNFIPTTNQIEFGVADDGPNNEADITATISSTYEGQPSIITLGTITTGIWNGTEITVSFGGTGTASLTENGVLFGNGTSPIEATTVGTAGQILTSNGATFAPTFQDISTGILPVPDTTSIVEGDIDDTKQLRFEVDGNTGGILGVIATEFTTAKTITIPDADDTLVGLATTDILTNKTIDLSNNTITGTTAEFNTALSDDDFVTINGTETILGVKTFDVGTLVIAGSSSGTTVLDATADASGTLTLPAATDTLVGLATTDILTNKTLTAPQITSASSINDANDNELILFPAAVANAVNEITITNAVTGVGPTIISSGETNIDLNIDADGTGDINLLKDVNASGDVVVGDRLQGNKGADVASASTITLVDGNYFDVTGSVTIANMTTTNWQSGSVVILHFISTPTITNGAGGTGQFLLQGNFNAAAGNLLTVVLDGTDWRETSRAT